MRLDRGGIIFNPKSPAILDRRKDESVLRCSARLTAATEFLAVHRTPRCCLQCQRRFMLTDHNDREVKGCVLFLFRFPSVILSFSPSSHPPPPRDRWEMLFPVFVHHIQSACSCASSQSSKPFQLEILMFASINRLN